jgi:hypothetical protein
MKASEAIKIAKENKFTELNTFLNEIKYAAKDGKVELNYDGENYVILNETVEMLQNLGYLVIKPTSENQHRLIISWEWAEEEQEQNNSKIKSHNFFKWINKI